MYECMLAKKHVFQIDAKSLNTITARGLCFKFQYSQVTITRTLGLNAVPTSLCTSQAYSAASSRSTGFMVRLLGDCNDPQECRPEHCTLTDCDFTNFLHLTFCGEGYASIEHDSSRSNPSGIVTFLGLRVSVGLSVSITKREQLHETIIVDVIMIICSNKQPLNYITVSCANVKYSNKMHL